MDNSLITTQMLADLFQTRVTESLSKPDNLKWVVYLRKSTDETGKQIRSIDDQRKECIEYAKRNNLKIVEIIEEKRSAKESGSSKRPLFYQMLKYISTGTYDAILAWHPDRLARNMKDAGEIIDLLDKDSIKDLQFVSFTFNNDPSGKLLLGITFALSKEYSDKLSENVKRGTYNSIAEGKVMGHIEHGYKKDEVGLRRPDAENFYLVQNLLKERISGMTLEKVAESFNLRRLEAGKRSSKILPKLRKQEVAKLIAKPVYAGVVSYGRNKEVVDLTTIYEFQPMITPEEYLSINKKATDKKVKSIFKHLYKSNRKAHLLNGCVYCYQCNQPMICGITARKSKSGVKNYYYFRCDQKGCPNLHVGTRAKVIIDYVCDYLKNNFKPSRNSWLNYQIEAKKDYEELRKQLFSDLSILTREKIQLTKRQNNIKEEILDLQNRTGVEYLKQSYEKDFRDVENKLRDLEVKITDLQAKTTHKLKILDQKDFLEQMQNLHIFIRQTSNMQVLDQVIRKIFLNFTVTSKNVDKSTLNSPFIEMFETKVSSCAEGGT